MSEDATDSLYPFGFLLGPAPAQVPAHFAAVAFPVPLHIHAGTKIATVEGDGWAACLTGELVHPEHPHLDLNQLLTLAVNAPDRQAVLDEFIGRWAFIHTDGTRSTAQCDASAMRQIYYAPAAGVLGSHALLVAEASGEVRHSAIAESRKLGCPGISTPYAEVYRLPPNLELTLETGQLRRIFPLRELEPRSPHDAWRFAFERAATAAGLFAARGPLAASLTAGRDSRATLLALRSQWPSTLFFTYTRGVESHDIDCAIAERIARTLGLTHKRLAYAETPLEPALQATIKRNAYSFHQHRLALAYHADEDLPARLHVRSNLLELARSNLFAAERRAGRFTDGLTSPRHLTRYYCRAGGLPLEDVQLDAFTYAYEQCDLKSALDYASSWDLFFVEHRMGAWRSGLIEESDIAFDTVNLFNSREIISAFMGVPDLERASAHALKDLWHEHLPQLDDIPINPRHLD